MYWGQFTSQLWQNRFSVTVRSWWQMIDLQREAHLCCLQLVAPWQPWLLPYSPQVSLPPKMHPQPSHPWSSMYQTLKMIVVLPPVPRLQPHQHCHHKIAKTSQMTSSRNMGGNHTQELSPLSPLPWLPAIDCQSELKRRKKWVEKNASDQIHLVGYFWILRKVKGVWITNLNGLNRWFPCMINMLHSPNVTIFLQRESSYVPHCIHMGNTGLEESINLWDKPTHIS